MNPKKKLSSLGEFKTFVEGLRSSFKPKQLILLSGPLGAGKTQFVRFLAGLEQETSSPSFALHNHYDSKYGPIDHVDLYRLENEDDLESTGFWDLFEQDQGWIVVEWADRLNLDVLPKSWSLIQVNIQLNEDESRSISIA